MNKILLTIKSGVLVTACFLMVMNPVLMTYPLIAHAEVDELIPAASPTPTADATPSVSAFCDEELSANTSNQPVQAVPHADPGEGKPNNWVYLYDNDLQTTYPPLINLNDRLENLHSQPGYDAALGRACINRKDLQGFYDFIPTYPAMRKVFDSTSIETPKIEFKNKLIDKGAFTGEPCRKPTGDGTGCDETLGNKPQIGADGKQVIKDGVPQTVKAPLYYDDTIWPNGHWDAPKADLRILESLVYLVTPIDEGGAGHEYIHVDKVLQESRTDPESTSSTTTTLGVNSDEGNAADDLTPRTSCGSNNVYSPHYYDKDNPASPNCLSVAVDIDQIDKARVTTRITEKKRVGSDKVTYKYNSFPIKVAYQSDSGTAAAGGLPDPTVFASVQKNYKMTLLDLLDQFGLQMDVDTTDLDVKNLGDLADALGKSVLSQLLNSPSGGLSGYDFPTVMENLGRAYLGHELGLVPGALQDREGDLVENIGRASVEYIFGFPHNSLKGSQPADIYTNIGRRYMEDNVLKVTAGTLTPSAGFPITNQIQLAQQVGEGRVEKIFGFLPGSMRKTKFEDMKNASFKAGLVFRPENAQEITDRLYLAFADQNQTGVDSHGNPTYTKTGKDAFGFTATDFDDAAGKLMSGKITPATFFQLVGDRQLSTTIGAYSTQGITPVTTSPGIINPDGRNTGPFGTQTALAACWNPTNDRGANGQPVGSIKYPCDPSEAIRGGYVGKVASCANVVDQFYDSNPLDACNPKNLTTTFGEAQRNQLQTTGLFSSAELKALQTKMQVAFDLPNMPYSISKYWAEHSGDINGLNLFLVDRYNEIVAPANASDPTKTGWKTYFTAALAKVTTKLAEVTAKQAVSSTSSDGLLATKKSLETVISQFTTYQDAIMTFYKSQGQSGRSAALDLSGIVIKFNKDGTINPGSFAIASADTMSMFMAGNFSGKIGDLGVFEMIGRQVAAQKLTTDKVAQQNLVAAVFKDLDPTFKILEGLGISDQKFRALGLEAGDLDRIFAAGLSTEVFNRIGQDELLKSAWGISGIAKIVNGAATSESDDANQILADLKKITTEISFYTSRVNRLARLSTEITTLVNTLENSQQNRDFIAQLQAAQTTANKATTTISSIRASISAYELALKKAQVLYNSPQTKAIRDKLDEGIHIINEIIAGHALDFTTTVGSGGGGGGGSGSSGNNTSGACWTSAAVRAVAQNKTNRTQNFQALAQTVAGCKIDAAIGLPQGSMVGWLAYGKSKGSYDYRGLAISVGRADDAIGTTTVGAPTQAELDAVYQAAYTKRLEEVRLANNDCGQGGITSTGDLCEFLSPGQKEALATSLAQNDVELYKQQAAAGAVHKSTLTDDQAYTRGDAILRRRAEVLLAGLIPGFADLERKYQLTQQDLADLFSGRMEKVFARIGESMLDKHMNWKPGTAGALVSPVCYDPIEKTKVVTCTSKQAEAVRLRIAAQLGFQALGLNGFAIPTTLDLTRGGSLLTTYGRAVMSEAMGLSDNSFEGTYRDVRQKNTTSVMLSALGLYDNPYVRQIRQLKAAIASSANGNTTTGLAFQSQLDYLADTLGNQILDEISNPASEYWIRGHDRAKVDALIAKEGNAALDALSRLASTVGGTLVPFDPTSDVTIDIGTTYTAPGTVRVSFPAGGTIQPVSQPSFPIGAGKSYTLNQGDSACGGSGCVPAATTITPITGQGDSAPILQLVDTTMSTIRKQIQDEPKKYEDLYINRFQAFHDRLDNLQRGHDLTPGDYGNTDHPDLFWKFITDPSVKASSITDKVAKNVMIRDLAGKKFTDAFNNLPEGPLKASLALIMSLSSNNSNNCLPGDMLVSAVGSGNNNCSIGNIADIDLNELFTGDRYKTQRGVFYDGFLAKSFGAHLEKDLGIPAGTIRRMVVDPTSAADIANEVGIKKLADMMFAYNTGDSAREKQLKQSFHDAFIDAFYVECGLYDDECEEGYDIRHFDRQAFTSEVRTALYKQVDEDLKNFGIKTIGATITRSDLQGIISGDPNASIAYLGVQYAAFQINKSLIDTKDPRSAAFMISYFDVRLATNGDPPKAVMDAIYKQAFDEKKASIMANREGCTQPDTYNYNNEPCMTLGPDSIKDFADTAGKDAQSIYAKKAKKDAQTRLQYAIYDAMAFKVDQDIPVGFARAMLAGTESDKLRMMGEFAFNSLGGPKLLAPLTAENVAVLYDLFRAHFDDTKLCTTPGPGQDACKKGLSDAIINLNTLLSNKLESFGLPKLPSGTLVGFFAWAKTGFKSNTFDDAKLKFMGADVPSIGYILKDLVTQKIFAWTDHQLGFKAGDSYKIYKAYQAYTAALDAVRSANTAVNNANLAMKAVADHGGHGLAAAQSQASTASQQAQNASQLMNAAKAAIVTLVIDVVFADQLAAIDQKLGLVPGTAAGVVGAAVAWYYGIGNPLITLGILLAMNLFMTYKVVVDVRGTGDGYYPMGGPHPSEASPAYSDYPTGEFNPQESASYHAGVKKAAQMKVHSVLEELLLMPTRWGKANGIAPKNLWISQVFTLSDNSNNNPLADLTPLISAPAPWDDPAGLGYGSLDKRTTGTDAGTVTNGIGSYVPLPRYRAGFFPGTQFWGDIHIRW